MDKRLSLWLLTRPWKDGDEIYDCCCNRVVVAADGEAEARQIASEGSYCEGPDVWLNDAECQRIGIACDGITGVVIRDVLEG